MLVMCGAAGVNIWAASVACANAVYSTVRNNEPAAGVSKLITY